MPQTKNDIPKTCNKDFLSEVQYVYEGILCPVPLEKYLIKFLKSIKYFLQSSGIEYRKINVLIFQRWIPSKMYFL